MQSQCDLNAFSVIHRDDALLAVHKPAALLVHRSPIDRYETRFALQMARDCVGQRVHAVHRLDKATSGLLLFALDGDSARHLSRQFEQREVEKRYLALVRGWPPAQGCIDKPLRYKSDALADGPALRDAAPQPARTHFRRLATATLDQPLGRFPQQRYALLALQPETGRKHQIRRHLNHIGHPIIGDVNHGDRHHNHLFHAWRGYHRLYLAAVGLRITHPQSNETLELRAPLQADFQSTLAALGLSVPVDAVSA